ncbi:hypothetical protein FW774_07055 [Pedobacter sp. BS3]|uniref:hypothetical protein n=1 Tax=Pedobacter sp. BS3 TaxID=2567937 RepID=UPI0011EDD405|nr:hypothetical protein [Pedobacter sp. BS3]TZF84733.1 hypothetical protein FW774_07055 [Pedobacter sp. BS3]
MRVVAELPRPDCKITIFFMNGKFIIKIEKGSLEQTYKLAEMDLINGLDDVFKLLDEEFIQSVIERFKLMSADFRAAYSRSQ